MKKLKMKDIADDLNLSVSTISKALSNSSEISKKTKELIRKYVNSHNFKPNLIARNLKFGRSKLIGIILKEHEISYYSSILFSIERTSSRLGYTLILKYCSNDEDSERACIDSLMSLDVEGLIIASKLSQPSIGRLKKMIDVGFPVVVVDNISCRLNTVHINIDINRLIENSLAKMFEKGNRKLIIVTVDDIQHKKKVFSRCFSAHEKIGVVFNENQIITCGDFDYEISENYILQRFREIIYDHGPIDGIVATSETLTYNCVMTARKLEDEIGRIDIIGFSNSIHLKVIREIIGLVPAPSKAIGEIAVSALIEMINFSDKKPSKLRNIIIEA